MPAFATSPIRLECSAGSSNKFWEVRVEGSSYEVRYGRIGTAGRTQTKAFGTAAEAQKAADAALRSKLSKGYDRVSSDAYVPSSDDPPAAAGRPAAPPMDAARFAALSRMDRQVTLFNADSSGLTFEPADLGESELRAALGASAFDALLAEASDYPHGTSQGDVSLTEVQTLKRGDEVLAYQLSFQDTGTSDYDSPIDIFYEVAVDSTGAKFFDEWSENG